MKSYLEIFRLLLLIIPSQSHVASPQPAFFQQPSAALYPVSVSFPYPSHSMVAARLPADQVASQQYPLFLDQAPEPYSYRSLVVLPTEEFIPTNVQPPPSLTSFLFPDRVQDIPGTQGSYAASRLSSLHWPIGFHPSLMVPEPDIPGLSGPWQYDQQRPLPATVSSQRERLRSAFSSTGQASALLPVSISVGSLQTPSGSQLHAGSRDADPVHRTVAFRLPDRGGARLAPPRGPLGPPTPPSIPPNEGSAQRLLLRQQAIAAAGKLLLSDKALLLRFGDSMSEATGETSFFLCRLLLRRTVASGVTQTSESEVLECLSPPVCELLRDRGSTICKCVPGSCPVVTTLTRLCPLIHWPHPPGEAVPPASWTPSLESPDPNASVTSQHLIGFTPAQQELPPALVYTPRMPEDQPSPSPQQPAASTPDKPAASTRNEILQLLSSSSSSRMPLSPLHPNRLGGFAPQQASALLSLLFPSHPANEESPGLASQKSSQGTPWPSFLAASSQNSATLSQSSREQYQQSSWLSPQQRIGVAPGRTAGLIMQLLGEQTSTHSTARTSSQLARRGPQTRIVMTPQQLERLTPQQVAGLTPQEMMGLMPQHIAGLTSQQLTGQSQEQLAGLTLQQLTGLIQRQLAVLTSHQLAGLTPEQSNVRLPSWLTPQQLEALNPQQTAALTVPQSVEVPPHRSEGMTPELLAALTPQQMRELSPAQLAALRPQQVGRFGVHQLAGLTSQQLAALTPQQLAALTPRQLAALVPAQIADVFTRQSSGILPKQHSGVLPQQPSGVLPEQPSGVLPEQPSDVLPERPSGVLPQQPSDVLPERPSGVLPEQPSGVLPVQPSGIIPQQHSGVLPEQPSGVLPEQHPGVLPQQPSGVLPEQPSDLLPQHPSGVLPEQPSDVLPEQHSGVLPQQHSGVFPQHPSGVLPQQSSDVLPEQHSGVLPEHPSGVLPERPAGVLPERPTGVLPERTSGVLPEQPSGVLPQQPSGLLPQQPSGVLPEQPSDVLPQQPSDVLPEQPSDVLPEQASGVLPQASPGTLELGSLTSEQLQDLSPAQLAGLTPEQLGGLTPLQLGGLTPEQLGGLTPLQLGGLTPEQLGGLTPLQLGGLTPEQLGGLTPLQLGGLTPEQLGGLIPEQLGGLTPLQLGGLTPEQLGGLTPLQLGGLTPEQLGGLTPEQLGGLTPLQLGGLTPLQLGGLTPLQLGGLTPLQLGGLTPEQLGGLTREQLGGLTREQLGGLTREQLGGLTPLQLGGLTPLQLGGLTPSQLSTLTLGQWAGLKPSQLAVLTPEQLGSQQGGETCQDITELRCEFTEAMCGNWTANEWSWKNGLTVPSDKGPSSDRSGSRTGHFGWVRQDGSLPPTREFRLTSPTIRFPEALELRVYFFFSTAKAGDVVIKLFNVPRQKWVIVETVHSSGKAGEWFLYRRVLPALTVPFRVTLAAKKSADGQFVDVAVDGISGVPLSCKDNIPIRQGPPSITT